MAMLFYGVFSALAVIGLAFTSRWIPNFKIAFISAKPLGLLILGYFIWLFSSFNILDFQNTLLLRFLFIIAAGASFWYLLKNWPKNWRNFLKDILWIELFWIILYVAYLWLRSHNAEIHGTERFMDMAFFNASALANYFPPLDPWRAGEPINYYYYGHYIFALVSRLSGIPTNFGYTFTLGLIFSSTIMLSWALVKRFINSNLFAALAGFFAAVSGTIAYSFCVLASTAPVICSYAKSTRLYEPSYIINEIPSYSFTVGDLHAHLIALPFFILALFFLYELFGREKIGYGLIGVLAVILASLGMINPWDFVSLALIVFLIAVFKLIGNKDRDFASKAVALGVLSIVLMLPFLMHFESGAAGIEFAPFYATSRNLLGSYQYPTPLSGWLGMWGGFSALLALCFFIFRNKIGSLKKFPALLVLAAGLLLIGVELFFIKDIYSLANPPYFRANTVFKFGFHAWTLLSLSTMILSAEAFRHYRFRKTWLLSVFIMFFVFFGFFYPVRAIGEFYLSSVSPETLDGSMFLKTLYPDDYAAIIWLNENVRERKVVVEAAGDSYKDYGRISVFSGMINPVNWLTHEWGWHFKPEGPPPANPKAPVESGWGKIAVISGDVRKIYESSDIKETKTLLRKYGAEFAYIGDLERKEYPNLLEQKFYELGKVVFSSGNSKLFKVND